MNNKIINLDYIKNLVDTGLSKIYVQSEFENIINNIFLIPVQDHFLFGKLYEKSMSDLNICINKEQLILHFNGRKRKNLKRGATKINFRF